MADPNAYCASWATLAARLGGGSEVRCAGGSQGAGLWTREFDKDSRWGAHVCVWRLSNPRAWEQRCYSCDAFALLLMLTRHAFALLLMPTRHAFDLLLCRMGFVPS